MKGGLKTACRKPGCPEIVEGDFCGDHGDRKRSRDRRQTASQRGYDAKWRRSRNQYLATHPYCEDPYDRHGGYPPKAREVDHITPLTEGGARLDPRNAQALCRGCHERKKRRECE